MSHVHKYSRMLAECDTITVHKTVKCHN